MAKISPFDVGSEDILKLSREVRKSFESLATILTSLTFQENFNSFLWSGSILAGQELSIKNKIKKNIPTGYLIIFNQGGIVQAGDSVWTNDFLYMKNSGTDDASVKIIFFV